MALRGIKVLEFAGLAPGPYCGEKIYFQVKRRFSNHYFSMAKRYDIVGFRCNCYKNRSSN